VAMMPVFPCPWLYFILTKSPTFIYHLNVSNRIPLCLPIFQNLNQMHLVTMFLGQANLQYDAHEWLFNIHPHPHQITDLHLSLQGAVVRMI
jgi:hypothetical protein